MGRDKLSSTPHAQAVQQVEAGTLVPSSDATSMMIAAQSTQERQVAEMTALITKTSASAPIIDPYVRAAPRGTGDHHHILVERSVYPPLAAKVSVIDMGARASIGTVMGGAQTRINKQ